MARTQPATLVFGAEVSNRKGTEIGHIQDLIVDLKSGQVIYVIVSFNQEKGPDDKYYPIPVKALKEGSENEEIVLDIEKERLQTAPSFDEEEWPKEYDKDFVQTVYRHYGYNLPER